MSEHAHHVDLPLTTGRSGTCAGECCAPDTPAPGLAADRRAVLSRRVRLLVAATITERPGEGDESVVPHRGRE